MNRRVQVLFFSLLMAVGTAAAAKTVDLMKRQPAWLTSECPTARPVMQLRQWRPLSEDRRMWLLSDDDVISIIVFAEDGDSQWL